jgi:isoamylase
VKDIVWLRPEGEEMTDTEWSQDFARCLGVWLSGQAVDEVDERGRRIQDDNFLVLINAQHEEIPFFLPAPLSNSGWIMIIDSSCRTSQGGDSVYAARTSYPLQARSLALLVERASEQVRRADRRRSPSE